jgi:hypothetical protein
LQRYKNYKYNNLHALSSSSLCIGSVFILLIYSLSITDIAYIVPQATAYNNTTSNSLNIIKISLSDSNQNKTAQTAAKIYFERSGGFAGISSNITIDTHSLPSDEANKIQGMINNAKFFDLKKSSSPPPKRAADYYKYKITIQTEEEGTQNTIETNDITMPSELRPLINHLVKLLPITKKQ